MRREVVGLVDQGFAGALTIVAPRVEQPAEVELAFTDVDVGAPRLIERIEIGENALMIEVRKRAVSGETAVARLGQGGPEFELCSTTGSISLQMK